MSCLKCFLIGWISASSLWEVGVPCEHTQILFSSETQLQTKLNKTLRNYLHFRQMTSPEIQPYTYKTKSNPELQNRQLEKLQQEELHTDLSIWDGCAKVMLKQFSKAGKCFLHPRNQINITSSTLGKQNQSSLKLNAVSTFITGPAIILFPLAGPVTSWCMKSCSSHGPTLSIKEIPT